VYGVPSVAQLQVPQLGQALPQKVPALPFPTTEQVQETLALPFPTTA
jgi:hypothetical protein